MGRNFGRITSITTDAVTILETTKDNSGAWIEKEVIKPIPRQGGKK
jgi:Tfp pilus assembly protein PilP